MPATACPSNETLNAFHLGELPDAEADSVSRHLDDCPACEARAQALDTRADPMVLALRNSAAELSLPPDPAAPPDYVAGYQVLGELGRGGMGVVYKARQVDLNRVVAVKMILAGRFAGVEEQIRFRIEGEVLARLRHPNIVQVFETGRHDGRPFLVLEWVEGGNLERLLTGPPPTPAAAAGLIEHVARAVHYAHLNGVVHRDLKPANVLIAKDGTPKVTDFGLAKGPAADAALTATGVVMGTPNYMAPEQAAGKREVGPAADVYAIGAILFAVLTGRPPFLAADAESTLYAVLTTPAPPASRFRPGLPRDLVTVCGRCLEKDPGKRYASAGHLADDLRRFREGRPILARPTPVWERAWLAARRHPVVAALAAAVALSLAAGVGLAGWQWRAAVAARGDAEAEARRAGGRAARLAVEKGLALCEVGEVGHGLLWLARGLEQAEAAGDPALVRAARVNLAEWLPRVPRPGDGPVSRAAFPRSTFAPPSATAAAFDRSGNYLATIGRDYCLELWRLSDGKQVNPSRQLWSPAGLLGRFGASSSSARDDFVLPLAQPVGVLNGMTGASSAAFSPRDDFVLALAQPDGYATVWEARPETRPRCLAAFPHPNLHVWDVAFSPDGEYLVTGCGDGTARVWRAPRPDRKSPALEPRPALELVHHPPPPDEQKGIYAVAFPAADLVVTGSRGDGTCLWRIADAVRASTPRLTRGEPNTYSLTRHGGNVFAVGAWRGGGRTRVLVGGEGEAELWELADSFKPATREWEPRFRWSRPLPGLAARLSAAAFAPDGRTCLTADRGEFLRLWDADGLALLGQPVRHGTWLNKACFDPAGRRVAVAGDDGTAAVWTVPVAGSVGPPLDHAAQPVLDVWVGPDGEPRTATLGHISLWTGDPPLSEQVWDRAWDPAAARERSIGFLAIAPDGGAVLIGAYGARENRVWGLPRFGPDGATFPERLTLEGGAFSPDGRRLLTLSAGKSVAARLWDVTGDAPRPVPGWGDAGLKSPRAAAFAPDGGRVLVGGAGGAVWLDAATGRADGDPLPAPAVVTAVAVRADGSAAVGCLDGTIRFWGATRREPHGPAVQAAGAVTSLAFAPDGAVLLSGSADRTARFWDPVTGLPLGPPFRHRGPVNRARFAPDGRSVLTAGADGLVRRWPVPGPPGSRSAAEWAAGVTAVTGMEFGPDGVLRGVGGR